METLLDETMASRVATDSVPPMRISVRGVCVEELQVREPNLVHSIDTRLQELSFLPVRDFRIAETGELLRVLLSDDQLMLAAIRLPAEGRLYAEFVMDIGDGRIAGVGNPPAGSIAPDDTSVAKHFCGDLKDNSSLLSQMWLEAKEMADRLDCRPIDAAGVAELFERLHAAEMDWRMQHGGISEEEARASLGAQGVTASSDEIESVQLSWQRAIDNYILQNAEVGQSVAADPNSRLLVVHDHSIGAHLEGRLAELSRRLSSDPTVKASAAASSIESCRGLLATMLQLFPARDAIARLRPHLPDNCRYQLLESITNPVAADIYLFPDTSLQSGK
ncbi:MAG: hypothetical protein Aurels2KO_54230 [Aureliella sp.]